MTKVTKIIIASSITLVAFGVWEYIASGSMPPTSSAEAPQLTLHLPAGEWRTQPVTDPDDHADKDVTLTAFEASPRNGIGVSGYVEAIRSPRLKGLSGHELASTMRSKIFEPIRACGPIEPSDGDAWYFGYLTGPTETPGKKYEYQYVMHGYATTADSDVYLHVTVAGDDSSETREAMRRIMALLVTRARVE